MWTDLTDLRVWTDLTDLRVWTDLTDLWVWTDLTDLWVWTDLTDLWVWTDLTLLSLSPANWLMTLKSSSNHPALFLTRMFVLFSNSGRNEHLCHLLTWVWIWKYVCKILCMICCLMYDIPEEETIQNYLLLVRLGVSVCFDSGVCECVFWFRCVWVCVLIQDHSQDTFPTGWELAVT